MSVSAAQICARRARFERRPCGFDQHQRRAAAGQRQHAHRHHARHRRTRFGNPRPARTRFCSLLNLCWCAEHYQPPDRSATARGTLRRHHSWRNEEQHYSRRSDLGMTLRTYSPAVRDAIIADVRRTAEGLAQAYGVPADRMPTVTLGESTPATINDSALAERLRASASGGLGERPRS